MIRQAARPDTPPVLQRLASLASLDVMAVAAIHAALREQRPHKIRSELLTEGAPVPAMRLLVHGWAARVRVLGDGRRQFLSFVLPGDLIGLCRHPQPLAVSTVVALTPVAVCAAPPAGTSPSLEHAYAIGQALEEAYLLDQITRLGRLNAQERIISLFLELHERLERAGLTRNHSFDLPLTQEVLADSLGLTSVHVNRMLQQARKDGDLQWRDGHVTLREPALLGRNINRLPVRVTSALN